MTTKQSIYSRLFPWQRVERGQGFFIPCLDVEAVRLKGLNEALSQRLFDARAYVGTRNKLKGVWFYRLPPAQS